MTTNSAMNIPNAAPKVIAEVAQGYEGKPDYCRLFVKAAAKAGADAVKFQIVFADDTAEPGYTYYDFYKSLQMDREIWRELRDQAKAQGTMFFCDVSGPRAMEVAHYVEPDGIKIHSSNFFNRSLIRDAAAAAPRLLLSLGGAFENEIEDAVNEINGWNAGAKPILMCGFQAEPTPVEKSKLARIPALRQRFPGVEIGYMDHVDGGHADREHVSIMAMTMGVDWLEKHLTLSRFGEIEDYVSALEPDEFAGYMETLKRLAGAFGTAELTLNDEELAYRDKSVKKIVAAQALSAGHVLTAEDLRLKRTPRIEAFQGIHDPRLVIGRAVKDDLAEDQPILEQDLT
jgi:sialic acid synthase SpsE